MDSTMIPDAVLKKDLKPEVEEKEAHSMISDMMSNFFGNVLNGEKMDTKNTTAFMEPFVEGMEIEGSYRLKDPCYNDALLNPDDPKCLKGSPWSEHA